MKFKILIVDDEKEVREVMKAALSTSDFEFYESENASEALKKMNDIEFDMVITDFNMPVTNGIELTKKIKAINSQIPVVICSSDIWLKEHEATAAGAEKLVSKDFEQINALKKYLISQLVWKTSVMDAETVRSNCESIRKRWN